MERCSRNFYKMPTTIVNKSNVNILDDGRHFESVASQTKRSTQMRASVDSKRLLPKKWKDAGNNESQKDIKNLDKEIMEKLVLIEDLKTKLKSKTSENLELQMKLADLTASLF